MRDEVDKIIDLVQKTLTAKGYQNVQLLDQERDPACILEYLCFLTVDKTKMCVSITPEDDADIAPTKQDLIAWEKHQEWLREQGLTQDEFLKQMKEQQEEYKRSGQYDEEEEEEEDVNAFLHEESDESLPPEPKAREENRPKVEEVADTVQQTLISQGYRLVKRNPDDICHIICIRMEFLTPKDDFGLGNYRMGLAVADHWPE